jgi:hypothetical protein
MFKSSSILLTYTGESHGENLFFSLMQVSHMEKFYSSHLHRSHMERFFFFHSRLESNFCFGLVCKVVVEVKKEFYSFHLSHE